MPEDRNPSAAKLATAGERRNVTERLYPMSLAHSLSRGESRVARGLRLVALLGVTLAALPAPVEAQYFGRNKVQYDDFDFKVIRTPHFDFHFYPEAAEAVEDAARMGERWYERLARLFQHEFTRPKPVILYADHADFQQTNTLRGTLSEGTGGVTESLKNRVIMPLAGSYWDTDHVLGHELVHAFQYNIAQSRQGGGLQSLVRLPLWMIEGMAEYLSVGREDPLTAMWLRDAVRRDDLPTIEQLTKDRKYFPYRFGQAFWAYVGGTYGDEAVISVFRRALRVGVDPAIEQVLGIETDTLSAQWARSVFEAYEPLIEGRTPPEQAGTVILAPETGSGTQNVAPSVSPDGRYVAFMSEKDLFSIDLFLADAQTGEIIRKLSSANADPHADAIRFIDSSGSWSPDGSQFVFVVFAGGDNELTIVATENSDTERRLRFDEVGAISNPAWSPDGRYIAFSGQSGGVSDLYMVDLETEELTQLTNDRNADFQPAWSPDGSTIAFVTDGRTDFTQLSYGKPQLALLDVEARTSELIELFGPAKHINPQFAPDGRSLYFITDYDGFSDIYRYTFAGAEIRRVTQLATGVSGISWMSPAMTVAREAGTVVFSLFDKREFHLYALDLQQANEPVIAVRDVVQSGRLLAPLSGIRSPRIETYLKDSQTGLVPPGTYVASDAEDYDSDLQLDYVGQPSIGAGSGAFGGFVSGGASAYFSDMLGDRRLAMAFQANGSFKDIGGQVFYQNLSSRWNWGVSAGRIPYQFVQGFGTRIPGGGQQVNLERTRIFQDSFRGTVAYPFTSTRRVEFAGGFVRYSYDREIESQTFDAFGRLIDYTRETRNDLVPDALNMAQTSIALVNDWSFFGFTSPIRGGRSRLEMEATTGTVNFVTVTADYRRYFSPFRLLTVAGRGMHIGRYGSSEMEERLNELPVGFEYFMRGYAPESFSASECTAIEGDSCPEFNRLYGHRVGVANLELRVPFLGVEQLGVINFPYLPTELVAFADMGFAWNSTEPVNFRFDRNTAERVPVFSAGFSARTNLLGFLILETYYAFPFQRPDKGWHWGFSIYPGW